MKRKVKLVLAAALLLFTAAALRAEEKFGVKMYEGAKLDKDTSARVSEAFSVEAFCYRTSDSIEKVVAFYKRVPGLEFMGEGKEGAMFKKGDVDITIQNPWMNMTTGQLAKDTLITIAKQKANGENQE